MNRFTLILLWGTFPLSGCFRGLFSEAPRYLATEYVVNQPRIVAIRTNPIQIIGGHPVTFEALLLAPKDSEVEGWSVSTCGLNVESNTQTYIWDLLCFEKESEVTQLLSSSSLPHTISIPSFPEIDCEPPQYEEWKDTGFDLENDSDTGEIIEGWVPEGFDEYTCSHNLPIMMEATVDGSPVYAAGFTGWYASEPYRLSRTSILADVGIGLTAPTTAKAGTEVDLQVQMAADGRSMEFQWYIDDGYLKDSGITRSQQFTAPSEESALPITSSNNRLVIPTDYEGPLRIWVVVHSSRLNDFNMTWTSTTIEVTR